MALPAPPADKLARAPAALWRLRFAKSVPWLLAAFLLGVAIQVFLAGMSVLGGQSIAAHRIFAHVVELFPVLIAVAGFVGADRRAGWAGIVLVVLFQAQYLFLAGDSAMLRALHPTNGLAMFGVALALLVRRLGRVRTGAARSSAA